MLRAPLFSRDFALLWQGQLVSQLGNQAFFVGATYFTLEGTGKASLVAAVMMASTLPLALVGPVGGTLADRHSRRTILVAADLLRAISVGALGVFLFASPHAAGVDVALLIAAAAFSGLMGALFAPAAQAMLPDLVPGERLAAANALTQMSKQTCTLVGQALGGVLYAAWGAAPLLIVDAITFAYGGVSSWLMRADRRPLQAPPPGQPIRRYAADTREGLRYVWRRRDMMAVLTAFAGVNISFMPVFVLLPLYVRDTLGRGPEWYGFLLAASGGGALAGSLAAGAWLAGAGPRSPLLGRSVAGVASCVLVLAATRQPVVALAAFAAIGAISSLINVTVITNFQTAAPAPVRGRVMALVIAISTAAVPIGMGAGGVAGDLWRDSIPAVFAGCALAIAALAPLAWRACSLSDAPA